ncbi:NAD-dependent epimerase/dehydratase family protein [Cellulomonas sp. JH27-2]|uniref:NAD-dependent epimerase/dehydratase family protein n=1 Tax=Cellulomonas sp. JH27-2 TaxID=2774139 RepID=UPI00178259D4|nr:NAD-dependent epimerase/dehydratase family protein [Cellulomonas sp. JH27-2]MBD8060069.1 NAD-dependent epimerase/dehydratase family protein [Cellulomonas sp. JH27-2]
MRVLVTGGAGFIGRHVVRRLLQDGHDVTVLDSLRPDVHAPGTTPDVAGARLVQADVRDEDVLTDVVPGHDAVVHLAAKVGLGVDLDDITDYVSSNDLGTACVLRAALHAGTPRVVFASSMVVYGEGAYDCSAHGRIAPAPRRVGDLDAGVFDPRCPRCDGVLSPGLVSEDAPLDPRNVYATTKVTGEHLLRSWVRETGGSAFALRFHNVYGPGMPRDTPYAGVASLFRSELAAGRAPRVFEDGGQRRDFVHVDDVARAVVAAAGRPTDDGSMEPLNVGSGTVTTVGGLAGAMTAAMGGPEPVVTGQYRVGDVRHVTASSARARSLLGWSAQIPLDAGLADVLADTSGRPSRTATDARPGQVTPS